MRRECPRSAEVAAALAGGWDAGLDAAGGGAGPRAGGGGAGLRAGDSDDDLPQHVAGCQACADLVLVMSSLKNERDLARRSTQVPAAGLIWWRAQLHRRQAAARAAAAPVAVIHAATLALVIGAAVFLAWTALRGAGMPDLAGYLPATASLTVAAAQDGDAPSLLRYGMILAAAAWLTLGPAALYFALRKE